MHVIFVGPPGVGKGTQAHRLVGELEVVHLSTGEILRAAMDEQSPLGVEAKQYVEQGKLVPDHLIVDMIGERLNRPDCEVGWLLDGFPRNVSQARALDAMLAEQGRRIDLVLALTAPVEELKKRLLKRAEIEGRADDNPTTIAQRLVVYEQQTAPVLDYYRRQSLLQEVDGLGSPDAVFDRIRRAMDADRQQG